MIFSNQLFEIPDSFLVFSFMCFNTLIKVASCLLALEYKLQEGKVYSPLHLRFLEEWVHCRGVVIVYWGGGGRKGRKKKGEKGRKVKCTLI